MSQNLTMARMLGLADEVHPLEIGNSPIAAGISVLDYFNQVRKIHADVVIDLEYLTRFSAVVGYMSAAPLRVGFHSWDVWRGNLHNRPVAFSPYWHVVDNFLGLHKALRVDVEPDLSIEPALNEQEKKEADKVIERFGLDTGQRIIVINPNASTMALERRWPEEYFIELIDTLVGDEGLQTVLIGAPDEASFVGSLHKRLSDPDKTSNLAGKLSLAELVGLLKSADLLVTNDSGPLHLADLLGTRTVSFFGPETPILYGPRGDRHTVLYKGINCSPCISIYNAKTVRCLRGKPECLSRITVNEALEAVKEQLKKDRP